MSVEVANAFISRWSKASPSERANSQLFLSELCDLLNVPRPEPNRDRGYGFEYEVTQHQADGSTGRGRIDLFKRACFVLKSKQFQAAKAAASQVEISARELGLELRESSQPYRGSDAWDDAMIKARGQAERVKAVSVAITSYKEPVTPELLAKRFTRAKPADISEILCTMGHAHRGNAKDTYLP